MDSESPLPAKRLRGSLSGNLQLTECIREFKLPRQFPSMAAKLCTDGNGERNIRANCHNAAAAVPKMCYPIKMVRSKDGVVPNLMRKIKLKGKDGRDLGEVSVQDLPQNIQGKTICLAKNGVEPQPEISQTAEIPKSVTIGVLTPVNILKSETPIVHGAGKSVQHFETVRDKDPKKTMIVDQKKITSIPTDSRGRPQVLVFQSGKNWHMVKIGSTSSPNNVVQAPQSEKNIILGKFPRAITHGKVVVPGVRNQNSQLSGNVCNVGEVSSAGINKLSTPARSSMVVRRWSRSGTLDVALERAKSKSPVDADKADISKPKIEISRICGSSDGKLVPRMQTRLSPENGNVRSNDLSSQKSTNIRQDVMVVLPTNSPSSSFDEDTTITRVEICNKSKQTSDTTNPEVSKCYPARRDQMTTRKPAKASRGDDEKEDKNRRLGILEKALSTVEDPELREKALKALAECGIGLERLVPIPERKAVKDSDTQTRVFGLFDEEEFVYVPSDNPGVQRKRVVNKERNNVAHIVGNTHSQDLTINRSATSHESAIDPELSDILDNLTKDNEDTNRVHDMLTKSSQRPLHRGVVQQLERDFQTYKVYDDKGLLNIHRAVLAGKPLDVLRQLKVLKTCRESVDIHTVDGETSLELAVSYEVSPKIVKLLLEHGAQPTRDEEQPQDSALIIASKKRLPILTDLISRVSSREALDNYDSSGFAALHYCAQNGDEAGVKALIRASADVDRRDGRSGRTGLFHAIENQHMDLAQMMLDNGAQPSIANYSGQTVVNLIDETKHYALAETLNRLAK